MIAKKVIESRHFVNTPKCNSAELEFVFMYQDVSLNKNTIIVYIKHKKNSISFPSD